jgi:hypothetical protein
MFSAKKPVPDRAQQQAWRQNELQLDKLPVGQAMAQVCGQLTDQLKSRYNLEVMSYVSQGTNELVFMVKEDTSKRPVQNVSNVTKKLKELGAKKSGNDLTYSPPRTKLTFKVTVYPLNTMEYYQG